MNAIAPFTPSLLTAPDPAALERSLRAPGADVRRAAVAQFEAVLLRQVLGAALAPSPRSGASGTPGGEIYQALIADAVTQKMVASGGLGLARGLAPERRDP